MEDTNIVLEKKCYSDFQFISFSFARGRMTGSSDINALGLLPDKLKTELALHVNLGTLKKV